MDIVKLRESFENKINKETYKQLSISTKNSLESIQKELLFYQKKGLLNPLDMRKFNRLKKLEAQMKEILNNLYKERYKLIENSNVETYRQMFNLSRYDASISTGLNINFAKINKQDVLLAITNPIDRLTLNSVLEKNRNDIIYRLQIELSNQILKGTAYREVAKSMAIIVDNDLVKANAIVRTENHRIKEVAILDNAKNLEKEYKLNSKKTWISTLDNRTREEHVQEDGTTIGIDENFTVGQSTGLAPGNLFGADSASQNINCRCTLIFKYDDYPNPNNLTESGYNNFKK